MVKKAKKIDKCPADINIEDCWIISVTFGSQ